MGRLHGSERLGADVRDTDGALRLRLHGRSTTSLALLHVDLPVNLKPSRTVDLYELADDIVLRNSSRS